MDAQSRVRQYSGQDHQPPRLPPPPKLPRLPPPPPPWIPLTAAQREALARRDRDVRAMLGTPLVGRDGLAEQFPRS